MLNPHWITKINSTLIGISPHPSGGYDLHDDLFNNYKDQMLLISHLTDNEIEILELKKTENLCKSLGIGFIHFPIVDRKAPDIDLFDIFIHDLYSKTYAFKHILIHCWGGIGRSAVTAIVLLLKDGISLSEAIKLVSDTRNCDVPQTCEQLEFLRDYEKRYVKE